MKLKLLILISVFLLATQIVMAQPLSNIFVQILADKGLTITSPKNDYFLVNETIKLHFHVYNSSGHLTTKPQGTTCILHIYSDNNGSHLYENNSLNMDSNNIDFSVDLDADLFKKAGDFPFIISCNNTLEGGFISSDFIISSGDGVHEDVETFNYVYFKSKKPSRFLKP